MKTNIHLNRVKLINPLNDERWDIFVGNHSFGMIYHHSSWMRVLALTHKQVEPLCFILEDENDNIRAALPFFIVKSRITGTRFVSLPFSPYSDPLVENQKDIYRLLDETIGKLEQTSASYLELRCLKNVDLKNDDRLKNQNYYKAHILDLEEGFKNISQRFHRDCIIRSVKKALRCGVAIRQGRSEQDLERWLLAILCGCNRLKRYFWTHKMAYYERQRTFSKGHRDRSLGCGFL